MSDWPFRIVLVGGSTTLGRLLAAGLTLAKFEVHCPDPVADDWLPLFSSPTPTALLLAATPDTDASAVDVALSRLAPQLKPALVLALSSYRVFSGEKSGFYVESDAGNAATAAAQPWLAIERWIAGFDKHYLLRTDRLFSPDGDNVLCRLLAGFIQQGRVSVSGSMRGCPTAEEDIARVLIAMLKQAGCGNSSWGTFHYCSGDITHCAEFAEAVLTHARQFQPLPDVKLVPVEPAQDQARPVLLSCRRLLDCFGIKQRSWRQSLPAAVQQYFALHKSGGPA